MTKAPRLTGKELKTVLEKSGFYLHHIEGSHHIMKRDLPAARISIPIHGSKIIKPGLYRRIVKSAGLTDNNIKKLL